MPDTETATIQTLAGEACGWFETAYRGDTGKDEDRYTRTKDDAPEWVRELVQSAHGDMFPDDWRYDAIRSALGSIHDDGDSYSDPSDHEHEWADGYVDVYTSARYAWLASNLTRQGYIDDAVSDLGIEPTSDVAQMIGYGQYVEAREVFASVVAQLEARLEAVEEDEDGEA